MADSKLTGLGEGTTIDKDSDYIYYVDSSDTTMSANGTSKRIKPKHIPISDAIQTALDAKQGTLVSGTSIKTVNSTSLLGSGNVAVQETLVSGTNIKTINGTSVLGAGDLTISTSVSDGDKGDITVSGSGTVWSIDDGVVTDDMLTTGINANKIANGDVSNTEFQYLSNVTSDIQTQLTTNASSASTALTEGKKEYIVIACSDETTALTTGTAKVTFRMPFAMTLTAVRASLSTAQSSGSILTVDINEAGTSILSTKLTIDNSEKTSTTAATAAVISDAALADDAEITIDIDQVGTSPAGLKVTLIGTR